jgi:peptidoglycan/xylan/chitin deacetylase (PgdA/CDA1 family)
MLGYTVASPSPAPVSMKTPYRFLQCLFTLALSLSALQVQAQTVAFTFDDGPRLHETPRMSPQARNQALLDTLAAHQVKAALFVTAGNGANKPEGLAMAQAWGAAGHAIGNHSMSHPDLNSSAVTLAQYQQEILDCDKIIRALPGYQKWYRFTYLREGNTVEKRDGMRAFLKAQHYRNAYVSLDTSDWRFDQKLVEVLKRDPATDIAPIRAAYLAHIRERALAYRDLSGKLLGRDIAQVILLHHNLVNAMWLGDVIAQFREMGWTIVTPGQAFADPVYDMVPAQQAAGQSLLLSLARSRGGKQVEDWARLVDDADKEMAQLKALGL